MKPRVVVIGAGMGGLAAAVALARDGFAVTVVEKQTTPGGKMRRVQVGDAFLDGGPTVLTMPWVFRSLFEASGVDFDRAVPTVPLSVLASHHWTDGSSLDLFADATRSEAAIRDFAGAGEAVAFRDFKADAKRLYDLLEGPFILSDRRSVPDMMAALGVAGLAELWRLGRVETLWAALCRRFRDPRLRQLFARYATYTGSSPFLAPATLMLVADVEMQGVLAVEGGMHALASAMAELAAREGASLRYGTGVDEILENGGRSSGVRLADGEELPADAVVFNGDVAALATGLLGPGPERAVAARRAADRSLSALVWCMTARASGKGLVRHNVFFDDDYASEFADVFDRRRTPRKGTVYVCAQDRLDDPGPRDLDRLLLLVNAPPTGDVAPLSDDEVRSCRDRLFELLTTCGLTLEPTAIRLTTPRDFEGLFPATGGALYGPASHGWTASISRPPARARLPGLYCTGGSVHPGAGVPMATLSGLRAASAVRADLASMLPSRRAAIAGGMSTR
jgi:1-hydroxycarotenoid 3,4-desaturase